MKKKKIRNKVHLSPLENKLFQIVFQLKREKKNVNYINTNYEIVKNQL